MHQLDLPGLSLQITPRRSYPLGTTLAHLLGYVGEAAPDDLKRDTSYRMGDMVGKTGLEKRWEPFLRGTNGGQQVEVDSVGRRLRVLREVEDCSYKHIAAVLDLPIGTVKVPVMAAGVSSFTVHAIGSGPPLEWRSAVPRHNEVNDHLARKICKDLGIPYAK